MGEVRLTLDRSEPVAERAGRRVAVLTSADDVAHAGPSIDGQDFDAVSVAASIDIADPTEHDFATRRVLRQIGSQLGHDERNLARTFVRKTRLVRDFKRGPAGPGNLAGFVDGVRRRDVYRHRTIVTRVPSPGRDSMKNSLERRFAPDRPRPSPLPVE